MAELCVYQQLSEAKGCRSIFFMCAQLSTSFYSLLYIWRVLGGLCGAVVGGLTDRQPLIGGIGVLFPNIQFSINQGKQLDSFIYILIYTSKHLWETTKWNIGVIKIKKKRNSKNATYHHRWAVYSKNPKNLSSDFHSGTRYNFCFLKEHTN